MIREGIKRWFHFRLCGWIGDHAPAGLVFQCVLRAYARRLRDINKQMHFSAEELLDESGRWAEAACKPRR
jgi:hypothetical protein